MKNNQNIAAYQLA